VSILLLQAWMKSMIGAFHLLGRIHSIAVEHGADGGGIIRVSWEQSAGRSMRVNEFEFDDQRQLADIVQGRQPPPWYR